MNWIAQCTNIVGQGALLLGVRALHRAGLAGPDAIAALKGRNGKEGRRRAALFFCPGAGRARAGSGLTRPRPRMVL